MTALAECYSENNSRAPAIEQVARGRSIVAISEGNIMDENINNAKDNLNEAKSDVKASITEHIEQVKTHLNDHVDHLSDKTKGAIVDVAQAVKKAAETVEGKFTKE